VVPLTYMNSSAAIKAFTGRHGGTVCTSSNAEVAMRWAFEQGQQVLFLPDQHLGRNTAVLQLGLSLDDCVVYDPNLPGGRAHRRAAAVGLGGAVEGPLQRARHFSAGPRRVGPRQSSRRADPHAP